MGWRVNSQLEVYDLPYIATLLFLQPTFLIMIIWTIRYRLSLIKVILASDYETKKMINFLLIRIVGSVVACMRIAL